VHVTINSHSRNILGRAYHHLFAAPGTLELVPHINMPRCITERILTGRRTNKIMWSTVLLQNVDTLEVYEEAIRQPKQDLEHHTSPKRQQTMSVDPITLPLPTPLNNVQVQAMLVQVGDPDPKQPKPTKTSDPAKQQRQALHRQITATVANRKRLLGATKASNLMTTIPKHAEDIDPNPTPQMEGNDDTLPSTNIPLPSDNQTEEEQFYDTESDEEHLELSNVQLSGTKEAQEDPSEDEN
jgi:hypothetical protein